MFGLSFWEIAIVLAVALVILGPTKLPELARSLGKGIREFRKATDDFKSTVEEGMSEPDPKLEDKKETKQARLNAGQTEDEPAQLIEDAPPKPVAGPVVEPVAEPVAEAVVESAATSEKDADTSKVS